MEAVIEEIIKPVLPPEMLVNTRFLVNPTGRFEIGGPHGDAGLTGRKIIVDTYGGAAPHGGGAFSGKDPSKVDRSAAYAARYVAKNIVAAGIARQCQVQLSYAIGVAKPINVTVYTEGTGRIPDEKIAALVADNFDLRPKGIIQMLDLLRPIYLKTAAYGHFGRDEPEFTWENIDRADALRAAAGLKGQNQAVGTGPNFLSEATSQQRSLGGGFSGKGMNSDSSGTGATFSLAPARCGGSYPVPSSWRRSSTPRSSARRQLAAEEHHDYARARFDPHCLPRLQNCHMVDGKRLAGDLELALYGVDTALLVLGIQIKCRAGLR